MQKIIKALVCFIFSSTVALPPSTTKQFRTDYVYNRKTDAFYKLHVESVWRNVMNALCTRESTVPIVITSEEDLKQVHMMMKQYPDLGDYVWVGDDGQSHESAEEQPIIDLSTSNEDYTNNCEVVTRDGSVKETFCIQKLPVVCKVEAKDVPYDSQCGTYVPGYKYYQSVGSCYKVSQVAYFWNEAYTECRAEGAHLVVINSEAEKEAIKNLTNTALTVDDSFASWFFLAGFRAEKAVGNATRVFKTIFNQTLEEAGYAVWSPNEPNNADLGEDCGSVFKSDGKLNDIYCNQKYPFICEKEVQTS